MDPLTDLMTHKPGSHLNFGCGTSPTISRALTSIPSNPNYPRLPDQMKIQQQGLQ